MTCRFSFLKYVGLELSNFRCEDAATFKGSGPRYVRGGGAREASDKIFQHNGKSNLAQIGHAFNYLRLVNDYNEKARAGFTVSLLLQKLS